MTPMNCPAKWSNPSKLRGKKSSKHLALVFYRKIKTSIARLLGDAGFKTERFGNEDTYVLLSVVTSRLPDGTCVSRYDTSLVTQADATLPYLKGLVAMPVQLLHEGGMAGGSPAAHASAVMDALVKSANRFVAQIRAANK